MEAEPTLVRLPPGADGLFKVGDPQSATSRNDWPAID